MKIGIAINTYKYPVFERHLTDAGFTFEKRTGPTDNTILLVVNAEDTKTLEPVVRAANEEATPHIPTKGVKP